MKLLKTKLARQWLVVSFLSATVGAYTAADPDLETFTRVLGSILGLFGVLSLILMAVAFNRR